VSAPPQQAGSGGISDWIPNIPGITTRAPGQRGDTLAQAMAKSAARTIGSSVGRTLVRGVLGSLLGGKR
ncbi:MAG: helicase HerA-like domain-containing protein, partial [Candidatus Acidiferrales bacterium]